jgi:hypothetical protein
MRWRVDLYLLVPTPAPILVVTMCDAGGLVSCFGILSGNLLRLVCVVCASCANE